MIEELKEDWQRVKESEPGARFQERYHRRKQVRQGGSVKRVLIIAVGAIIALGGLFLVPAPGPGWATVFIGLGLIGGESLMVARFLDWTEVKLRAGWEWLKKHMMRSTTVVAFLGSLLLPLLIAS